MVTKNINTIGITTNHTAFFLCSSQVAMVNKATAASNWLAEPKIGQMEVNSPESSNRPESTMTIKVAK